VRVGFQGKQVGRSVSLLNIDCVLNLSTSKVLGHVLPDHPAAMNEEASPLFFFKTVMKAGGR